MGYVTVQATASAISWRGVVYRAGVTSLPEDCARAMGWQPPTDEPTQAPTVPEPAALTLINSAASAGEIAVLPGIGAVSAGSILSERPAGGYASLEAVAQIQGLSVAIDWDEVTAWKE
ncbi:MAG: hypothetical protein AAFY74_20380 [Pseudomonadota bacterium]